mmetsp:Transcript_4433/g.11436  ORF Transcript_4433/g.11436 Transcript_4433/m.11436 type:complete len:228 (+) Transcript_4433:154-837(+)
MSCRSLTALLSVYPGLHLWSALTTTAVPAAKAGHELLCHCDCVAFSLFLLCAPCLLPQESGLISRADVECCPHDVLVAPHLYRAVAQSRLQHAVPRVVRKPVRYAGVSLPPVFPAHQLLPRSLRAPRPPRQNHGHVRGNPQQAGQQQCQMQPADPPQGLDCFRRVTVKAAHGRGAARWRESRPRIVTTPARGRLHLLLTLCLPQELELEYRSAASHSDVACGGFPGQ